MNENASVLQKIKVKGSSNGPLVFLPGDDAACGRDPFPMPLIPISTLNWLGMFGRRIMPRGVAQCYTDEDLLAALQDPDGPLYASQVAKRQAW